MQTIIFLTHRFKSGFERSAYIDFEDSLRVANDPQNKHGTDWAGVFSERCMLLPKPWDLSYFDWHTKQIRYNHTDNYIVMNDHERGLIFMHKGDHKHICVDKSVAEFSKNCTRSMYYSKRYGYVTFLDHIIRKKI